MLTRIEAPAVEPVTLSEAKAHLSVIGNADDGLLTRLISSAVAALDGPDGRLGLCLISQRWRYDQAGFPAGYLRLPMPPIIGVDAVSYIDRNGDEHAFADYEVLGIGSREHCLLMPAALWPYARTVSVEFTAGFGAAASDVPDDLRNAILAIVGAHYAWRESEVLAQGSLRANPDVSEVIERWRVRGFG